LRPAKANSLKDSISKTTRAKWTGGVVQAVECPEFKSQYYTHTYKSERERDRDRERERERRERERH
jgi:hypothetical protein